MVKLPGLMPKDFRRTCHLLTDKEGMLCCFGDTDQYKHPGLSILTLGTGKGIRTKIVSPSIHLLRVLSLSMDVLYLAP